MGLCVARERAEQRGDVVLRVGVEFGEGSLTTSGQPQQGLPAIGLASLLLDDAALLERAEDPAQVAGVEAQLGAEGGSGGLRAVGELVDNAPLGQGERAVPQMLL